MARPFLAAYVIVIGFTVGMLVNRAPAEEEAIPASSGVKDRQHDVLRSEREAQAPPLWLQIFRPSQPMTRWMLRLALPILTVADGSAEEPRNLLVYWTGRTADRPQTFFQTMLPFLRPPDVVQEPEPPDAAPPPPPVPGGDPQPPPPVVEEQPAGPPVVNDGLPLVGIYHTHDWESYLSEFPGLSIKTPEDLKKVNSHDRSKRTVVNVGNTVAMRLRDLGITTVHAPFSHGGEGYDWAYSVSRRTAKKVLKEAPSVKVLLDLHRDAPWGLDTTAVINGQKVAQVRCVIGKREQPRWQQNKSFCDELVQRLEDKYPGLTLPTLVQNSTYNQDLLPGAILLEMGGAVNHYDEAERAGEFLAEVLAEMIRDGAYPQ